MFVFDLALIVSFLILDSCIRGTNFKTLVNRQASAIPQNDPCDTQNMFLNLSWLKNFQQVPADQIFQRQFHKSKSSPFLDRTL